MNLAWSANTFILKPCYHKEEEGEEEEEEEEKKHVNNMFRLQRFYVVVDCGAATENKAAQQKTRSRILPVFYRSVVLAACF